MASKECLLFVSHDSLMFIMKLNSRFKLFGTRTTLKIKLGRNQLLQLINTNFTDE